MNSGIYKITNLINNKVYIGSTNHFGKRKNGHYSHLKRNIHENQHLQNAFNTYGESQLVFEIIEEVFDVSILFKREQYWIDYYKSSDRKYGYNKSMVAGSCLGYKHTEEFKVKQSIVQTGKTVSQETREKISNTMKGHKKSETTVDKMRQRSGENAVKVKLTYDKVSTIREMISQGFKNKYIAEQFNVDPSTISYIRCGKTWAT